MLQEILRVSFPKSYPVVFFLFCRPIRKSLTASRSWLKPMMRDWTSSSKNLPSWWMLNKQPKRTSTWVGWWDNIEGWSCSGVDNGNICEFDKRAWSSWHVSMFDVGCTWKGASEGLGCSLGLSSDRTAQHFTVLTDFYFRLQLFFRLIRMSWTAWRDCLMITTSGWTSSSKNPTSWRQLTKRIRRTTVTCWIGTDWWIICNLFLVARTCMVWCLSLKVLILCSHILHLRLEILSCHYSEVLERFLPLGDLHWDG